MEFLPDDLESKGLLRTLPRARTPGSASATGPLELHSNDYLGLARHPFVIQEGARAAATWGAGSTGSRLLSGNLGLHEELERAVARLKRTPSALLFNSGYSANLGILGALAGHGDRLVCDKLNHASLIDGAKLCGAEVRYYRHLDLDRAAELLDKPCDTPGGQKFLVTDSVFSMDGDIAPLPRLLELCHKHRATLILDEAHATGVLGAEGRGSFEHFGLSADAREHGVPGIVQMGTLGKALGGFGAFAACDENTRLALINRARPFVFSTSLPPFVLGSALAAIEILQQEPERLQKLRSNAARMRQGIRTLGLDTPEGEQTPIIPVLIGDAAKAVSFAQALERNGALALAVRPPTVAPGSSRIRVTATAQLSEQDLETALTALRAARDEVLADA